MIKICPGCGGIRENVVQALDIAVPVEGGAHADACNSEEKTEAEAPATSTTVDAEPEGPPSYTPGQQE